MPLFNSVMDYDLVYCQEVADYDGRERHIGIFQSLGILGPS